MSLVRALADALAEMDPAERVARSLPRRPHVDVSVVAIGKAAPAMAAGALRRWSDDIVEVLVVTTDGTDAMAIARDRRVDILRAGHPIPDARSVSAAERCLELARRARTLLVLVSGGASALVCAPAPGVSLERKQAITRALLASGASIRDVNVVRKHLSRIKGGGLARAARPAPVSTLVFSDVVGGASEDVGSGPAVGDESTVASARALLRRYAPAFADVPLVRTGPVESVVLARRIAAPEDLARALAKTLRARALRARVLSPSVAPVEELAREYVALARKLAPGTAWVRAAEPSVVLSPHAGRGGRSTHLAALVGLELPAGARFLAAATDGVDGTSGTGGALVTRRALLRVGEDAVHRALERYDTGPMHVAARTALPLRPTGHNLADVHVLVRYGP